MASVSAYFLSKFLGSRSATVFRKKISVVVPLDTNTSKLVQTAMEGTM